MTTSSAIDRPLAVVFRLGWRRWIRWHIRVRVRRGASWFMWHVLEHPGMPTTVRAGDVVRIWLSAWSGPDSLPGTQVTVPAPEHDESYYLATVTFGWNGIVRCTYVDLVEVPGPPPPPRSLRHLDGRRDRRSPVDPDLLRRDIDAVLDASL